MLHYAEASDTILARLTASNDCHHWLAQRQDLAIPILPPASPSARRESFERLKQFNASSAISLTDAKQLAKSWNQHQADAIDFFYITPELVLSFDDRLRKFQNRQQSEDDAQEALFSVAQLVTASDHQQSHFPEPSDQALGLGEGTHGDPRASAPMHIDARLPASTGRQQPTSVPFKPTNEPTEAQAATSATGSSSSRGDETTQEASLATIPTPAYSSRKRVYWKNR